MNLNQLNQNPDGKEYFLFRLTTADRDLVIVGQDEADVELALSDYGLHKTGEVVEIDDHPPEVDEVIFAAELPELFQGTLETVGILYDKRWTMEEARERIAKQVAAFARREGEASGYEAFPSELIDSLAEHKMTGRAIMDAAERAAAEDALSAAYIPLPQRLAMYLGEELEEYKVVHDGAFIEQEAPWEELEMSKAVEAITSFGLAAGAWEEGADCEDYILEHAREAFEQGCFDKDTTSLVDLLDRDYIMNWTPHHGGSAPEDNMVECDAVSGSAEQVVPDAVFEGWLKDMNISSEEWKLFMFLRGVDLSGTEVGGEAWDDFDFDRPEPDKPNRVSISHVAEIIDNTNGYGTPNLAIRMNLKDLFSLAPGEIVSVTGGQYGLHDYINGSGHIEDVLSEPLQIRFDPKEWRPDGSIGYGVDDVYGLTGSATDGVVTFPGAAPSAERYGKAYVEHLVGLLEEGSTVQPDGTRTVNKACWPAFEQNAAVVDLLEQAAERYGHRPVCFDEFLNEAELSQAYPEHPSSLAP